MARQLHLHCWMRSQSKIEYFALHASINFISSTSILSLPKCCHLRNPTPSGSPKVAPLRGGTSDLAALEAISSNKNCFLWWRFPAGNPALSGPAICKSQSRRTHSWSRLSAKGLSIVWCQLTATLLVTDLLPMVLLEARENVTSG